MAAQTEIDAISNRIQLALAAREELVRSWTSPDIPRKTDAELDAEEALLFRPEPAHLGVGYPIAENYLIGEKERGRRGLETKFATVLKASKKRDAEEKRESAKRGLDGGQESSEEDVGRSALGRRKKLVRKERKVVEWANQVERAVVTDQSEGKLNINEVEPEMPKAMSGDMDREMYWESRMPDKTQKSDLGSILNGQVAKKEEIQTTNQIIKSTNGRNEGASNSGIISNAMSNTGSGMSKEERKREKKRQQKRKAKERKRLHMQGNPSQSGS
jgi:hypothetical protein